ncbi:hypothetical protein [Pseudoponticoccus marisrubri]|uniref:ABC transporter ATP-binding protein n=1 Tax=Pseudoponticoccus marisrubri TaxID=1685382 RepID=A0A0W7WJ58_9RHOB|nr:hypothetical protein [Pseudoponticoccus marisrubri]KUF10561.1 ABC transporter ATP-binding protein [Pseudoponticoccus marisrubri]
MTRLADLLEDFAAPGATAPAEAAGPTLDEAEIEGQKLESFENGYRAGWDDAIKSQSEDKSRISSAFGQHLQDLSFTYHEAYSHVMNAMAPLLDEVVCTMLPQIARATLGAHIAEELHGLAREIGQLSVVVAVSPANVEAVAPLIDGQFAFPIELVADDTLAEEQADIRFAHVEKQIDLGDLQHAIAEAVRGFAHDNRRKAHG